MKRFMKLGLLDKILTVLYFIMILIIAVSTVGLSVYVWLEPTTQIVGVGPVAEFLIYWAIQLFAWLVVYVFLLHILVAELAYELWGKNI